MFDDIPFGVSFDFLPNDYPKNVSADNFKSSVSFLLAWSIQNHLLKRSAFSCPTLERKAYRLVESQEGTTSALLALTGNQFHPASLKNRAKAFLLRYYWPGWIYRYGVDFDKVFVAEYNDPLLARPGYASTWHVPCSWQAYAAIAPVIGQRYLQWQSSDEATMV